VWHFVGCVVFPSNEYNNGHPCLRQGLLIVLVPMIVYIAKRVIIFVPKFTKKSPFLNAQLAVLDPVGVDGVELPGVDVAGQAPQTIEIDDLNIPQPDPHLIKTVEEPTVPQMEQDEPTQVAQPMEITGLRRSTRVKIQPKQWPSMPTARIACCFSTNEFLLEIHMVSGVMLV
jgi:hypothetical protein